MDKEQETVEETETNTPEAQENENAADATNDVPETSAEQEEVVSKAEYEALKKEIAKRDQELNMRRNEAEKAKLEALEKTENYREAYEELKAKEAEREAAEAAEAERKQIEDLRNEVINEYPSEIQEIARDLNLYWDDATDTVQAKQQLKEKLDRIQSRLSPKEDSEESAPSVNPNNPAPDAGVDLKEMSADELKKILPHADPR